MVYEENNIFAKILRREVPFFPVYEDDNSLAFMDAMPQTDGHVLVIPKEPAETIFDLSDDATTNLILTVKFVARATKLALQAPGVMLMQLNGHAAGQTVPHIHFHIIPRFPGIPLRPHAQVPASSAALDNFARRIRQVIGRS